MEEYVDIVDENDRVIGVDTRENVHHNHQIHRGIHVFVVNTKGELLLQKRSLLKKDRPGYYDASVGAQVRSGETYDQAATRESMEELGFNPKVLTVICNYKSYSSRQRENRRLFIVHYDGPFNIDKQEVASIEFLSIHKIQEMIDRGERFTTGFIISFKHYQESIKGI